MRVVYLPDDFPVFLIALVALAPLRAISERCCGVSALALAGPPAFPPLAPSILAAVLSEFDVGDLRAMTVFLCIVLIDWVVSIGII